MEGLICLSQTAAQDQRLKKRNKQRRMQYFMQHGHFPEDAISANLAQSTSNRNRRVPLKTY